MYVSQGWDCDCHSLTDLYQRDVDQHAAGSLFVLMRDAYNKRRYIDKERMLFNINIHTPRSKMTLVNYVCEHLP